MRIISRYLYIFSFSINKPISHHNFHGVVVIVLGWLHFKQSCSEFESGGGQKFFEKRLSGEREIGVIPQGTRGGLRGAQRGGQGRYGSPVNQKL